MKAMILAAGRGSRLGAVGNHIPKALLPVAGRPLIAYHFANLLRAGISECVVNVHHLADEMMKTLGDGSHYGISIQYSHEPQLFETGGGIFYALPLLGMDPFIVINADVFTDFPLQTLSLAPGCLAHGVLVENPVHHPDGDYGLEQDKVSLEASPKYTFSGIGLYSPAIFEHMDKSVFRLPEVLNPQIEAGRVTGEVYHGQWFDVGTQQRLSEVREQVEKS